jgi:hypothetical protein
MSDLHLDGIDIQRMLDNPPVVLKSSRGKAFVYTMGGGLMTLVLGALFFHGNIKDAFSLWVARGLVGFLLLITLACAKMLVWPTRVEISEVGVVIASPPFARRYNWDDLGRIYFRKGYFLTRSYVPDRIVLEGRTLDMRHAALTAIWNISLADLLTLLTTAQKRWDSAGHLKEGTS